eukprot:m.710372 g.710372  ORF g.710372 m.710372 type:complete len:58 (+) comp22951_c0_seq7:303-476(+)
MSLFQFIHFRDASDVKENGYCFGRCLPSSIQGIQESYACFDQLQQALKEIFSHCTQF